MADYKIQLGVQLDSKAQENINNQLRKIETKIETATLSKKAISSIQDQLKSANLGITIDTTSIKKAQNEVNKLVDSVRKASGLSLGNQLKNNSSSKSDANFLADQQRILAQNEKYWKQNTAAAKEYEQQWTQAFSNVENAQSKAQLTTATKQINALKAEIDNELFPLTVDITYKITVSNTSELDYNSESYYKYGTKGTEEQKVKIKPVGVYDYLDSKRRHL